MCEMKYYWDQELYHHSVKGMKRALDVPQRDYGGENSKWIIIMKNT